MKNIFTMMMLGMFFSTMVCADPTTTDPLDEDEVEADVVVDYVADEELLPTAAHTPQKNEKFDLVEWLKSTDKDGKTPMHHVVYDNNKNDHVRLYIDKGADVNAKDQLGRSPMHYAAIVGNIEAMDYLCSHSADIGMFDKYGKTPLYYAAQRGQVEAVKWFLDKGVTPDGGVIDMLTMSIKGKYNNFEKLKEILPLLQKSRKNKMKEDALLQRKKEKEEKAKIENEISDMFKNNGKAWPEQLLEEAQDEEQKKQVNRSARKGNFEDLKAAVDKGADVNVVDRGGRTPVHRAAEAGDLNMLNYLHEHGAKLTTPNNHGKTPLYYAAKHGQVEAVKWFLEKGVTPDEKTTNDFCNTESEISKLLQSAKK